MNLFKKISSILVLALVLSISVLFGFELKPLATAVPNNIKTYNNRAEYVKATGKEAPEFDWSAPVKTWVDTSIFTDPETEISYFGISYDSNGEPNFDSARVVSTKRYSLFPEVAKSVNLLPEPFPAAGVLTPNQLKMSSRNRPVPLVLKTGEKLVLAPGIGKVVVVDDGKSPASNTPSSNTFVNSKEFERMFREIYSSIVLKP